MLREQLLNLLNTNDVNIRELSNKTAIFVIGKNGVNDIANIFIDQVVEVSDMSFTYIFDNFDELRKLISFDQLVKNASYDSNRVYVAVHNEDQLKEKYGKYVLDQFETVINMNDANDFNGVVEIGNECEYPSLSMKQHSYMNFKKLVVKE